ncbi:MULTISPECIES: hypothetical protein [unclassified Paenibacillus]|uniref:hypothetical protein n=1 Tax=unclassified Paenibacillus TaxID=185978 RepID=UPI001404F76F|nr:MULTISPECIES: hypothetical protein [unclassified Paenibacillus]NIK71095.1 hypothetical protein [Paenibacillus sp. BK720]
MQTSMILMTLPLARFKSRDPMYVIAVCRKKRTRPKRNKGGNAPFLEELSTLY